MDNRPYIQVISKNIVNQLLEQLDKDLPKFIGLDGIVGITLNDGLSKGYGDYLSEIDVTLYIEHESYKKWTYNLAPICLGITK